MTTPSLLTKVLKELVKIVEEIFTKEEWFVGRQTRIFLICSLRRGNTTTTGCSAVGSARRSGR